MLRSGRHVKAAPYFGSSGLDAAFALEASTIAVVGRQSRQRHSLVAVSCGELGQESQERPSGHLADAFDRLHELAVCLQFGVGLLQLSDFTLKLLKFFLQKLDGALDRAARARRTLLQAVFSRANCSLR